MDDEFEAIVLTCGHSINSYSGLGVCNKCKLKHCSKCLQLLDDHLLCPKCFEEKLGDANE